MIDGSSPRAAVAVLRILACQEEDRAQASCGGGEGKHWRIMQHERSLYFENVSETH